MFVKDLVKGKTYLIHFEPTIYGGLAVPKEMEYKGLNSDVHSFSANGRFVRLKGIDIKHRVQVRRVDFKKLDMLKGFNIFHSAIRSKIDGYTILAQLKDNKFTYFICDEKTYINPTGRAFGPVIYLGEDSSVWPYSEEYPPILDEAVSLLKAFEKYI